MEIKMERQFKRRGNRSLPKESNFSMPLMLSWKKEEGTSSKSKSIQSKEVKINKDKGKIENLNHNHDIQCFRFLSRGHITSQCLNKRAIITQVIRKVETDDESEYEEMPPLEEATDENFELTIMDGEEPIVRRALSAQIK